MQEEKEKKMNMLSLMFTYAITFSSAPYPLRLFQRASKSFPAWRTAFVWTTLFGGGRSSSDKYLQVLFNIKICIFSHCWRIVWLHAEILVDYLFYRHFHEVISLYAGLHGIHEKYKVNLLKLHLEAKFFLIVVSVGLPLL